MRNARLRVSPCISLCGLFLSSTLTPYYLNKLCMQKVKFAKNYSMWNDWQISKVRIGIDRAGSTGKIKSKSPIKEDWKYHTSSNFLMNSPFLEITAIYHFFIPSLNLFHISVPHGVLAVNLAVHFVLSLWAKWQRQHHQQ